MLLTCQRLQIESSPWLILANFQIKLIRKENEMKRETNRATAGQFGKLGLRH